MLKDEFKKQWLRHDATVDSRIKNHFYSRVHTPLDEVFSKMLHCYASLQYFLSFSNLQGVSLWNGLYELALTDKYIQVRFGLRMILECWDRKFLGTTTIFQKSSIGWPQQPLTEKELKFNLIFHDYTPKKYFFQNIKIKLNSRAWMTLKSPVLILQALEPQ